MVTSNEDANYRGLCAHVLAITQQAAPFYSTRLSLKGAVRTRLACTPACSVPGRL